VELVGEDHVVIGTDIPFDMACVSFKERVSAAGLAGGAVEAIESENVIRLFDLS